MGKAKKALKTVGEALITVIAWFIYMAIELITLTAGLILDLAVFPVEYMRKMKENEE